MFFFNITKKIIFEINLCFHYQFNSICPKQVFMKRAMPMIRAVAVVMVMVVAMISAMTLLSTITMPLNAVVPATASILSLKPFVSL